MQYILANTVLKKDTDERISRDNKAWAKDHSQPEDEDTFRHSAYLVIDWVKSRSDGPTFLKAGTEGRQEPEKFRACFKNRSVRPGFTLS